MIIKDTFHSLVPLNWLLNYVSLSNIYRKETQIRLTGSITKCMIYSILCVFLNIIALYYKIKIFEHDIHSYIVRFSVVIQLTYWFAYGAYIIDIYFVYKYGRDYLLRYLKTFDYVDTILRTPSYDNIRKTIVKTMVLTITAFVLISFFDFVAWVFVEGWKNPTIYAIDYLYFFLNMLTILDVISHIILVEHRLEIIQVLLQDDDVLTFMNPVLNIVRSSTFSKDEKSVLEKSKLENSMKTHNSTECLRSTWLSKCYLLLLEQVTYINISYGFRVMVHCVNVLFNMTNLLNLAIRVTDGTLISVSGNFAISSPSVLCVFLPRLSSFLRALNYELMAIVLMYRCEQAYRQSEKILEAVDMLLTAKKCDRDSRTELLDFRNLLVTRPIKFHAANFFTMDYTFLASLNSVIVTYTVIMLQNVQ